MNRQKLSKQAEPPLFQFLGRSYPFVTSPQFNLHFVHVAGIGLFNWRRML